MSVFKGLSVIVQIYFPMEKMKGVFTYRTLYKGQFILNQQMQTNSNRHICWVLLNQCATPVGVGRRLFEHFESLLAGLGISEN